MNVDRDRLSELAAAVATAGQCDVLVMVRRPDARSYEPPIFAAATTAQTGFDERLQMMLINALANISF